MMFRTFRDPQLGKKKAQEIIKLLQEEKPDYAYLKELFRHIRTEMNIRVTTQPKRLPCVPSETEIDDYYKAVWHTDNTPHRVMIKTLLYTGMRVGELVTLRIVDVDLKQCHMRIEPKKNKKERHVPFPERFKEALKGYIKSLPKTQVYLFESRWHRRYTTQSIRKILRIYAQKAKMTHTITPCKLRHFLWTWMKKQGIDDALLQAYSGHISRKSLEIYTPLSLDTTQKSYKEVIKKFPV